MTKNTQDKWDLHDIKAAIGKAGLTQTKIALVAGLDPSAVRHGLRGSNRKGAEAIAQALGVPFRTLFPDSYLRGHHHEVENTSKPATNTRAKHHVRADNARGIL